ncbi:MAG: FGGY-family carbohydrate kinase, partial [Granulosicoccus sp.]
TRTYSNEVIASLDLSDQRRLLPPMIDGASESQPLCQQAASAIGLPEGLPVILGYVDIICTALGAGLYDPVHETGCTIVGSTGVHMGLARSINDVRLNSARTGYTMPMPVPGVSAQIQTNMASTLNIDWLLDMAVDLVRPYSQGIERSDLINRIDDWIRESEPGSLIFHPYISDAGERGPFIDVTARASFIGLSTRHGFAELVRAVVEGLAFAARDCYSVMGRIPDEIRLTGGAARSSALREIFGSALGTVLRTTDRQEAGAAGAAMMAAVNIGHFESMDQCVDTWVQPLLGPAESVNTELHELYVHGFDNYIAAREALVPVWHAQAGESLQ